MTKICCYSLCLALMLIVPLSAQTWITTHVKMSAAEIEQLRQRRHDFYAAEVQGMNEAIRADILSGRDKVDGNQNDYDVRYYGIDLRLDFAAGTITGHVDYQIQSTIASLSQVDLNLTNNLTVSAVTVDDSPTTFTHSTDLLQITLPSSYSVGEEFELRVTYGGVPVYLDRGMKFGIVGGYSMCWTHCSPYAARYWWPCKDYPADKADSIDLYFEYPSEYVCAANGVMISDTDIGDGYKRIHYSHHYPINTYLVAVVCSDFMQHVQTWNYDTVSMPIYSYALPSAPEEFAAFQNVTPDVLTRLSDHWGLFPFSAEKAGSASYGWGGAMEHQTCVFYNPAFYDDWVIAHEQGHQWFGDMLSACNFHHVWLKEGFACYSESIYFEDRDGPDAYLSHMLSQKYIGPGTVYVEDLVNDEIFDPNLTYDKAAWVVHMLRGVIGYEDFFESIANYRTTYEYGCATTENLSDIVSNRVGEDMGWFFEQWVYGSGNPNYEYSWRCEASDTKDGYELLMFINQVQTYGTYFTMPIRMEFQTTGGEVDATLANSEAESYYEIHFSDSVTSVALDPDQWILRVAEEMPMALHMLPRQLADGYLNVDYREELRAINGVPPYSWTMVGGDLPFGVTFDADSALFKGTPSWAATYYFTLRVTDSDSPASVENHAFAIVIHSEPPYICGDADGNQIVNISDAVYLITYIFGGGPAPDPLDTAEVDCNGIVNISDAVYLISYIFAGGPAPCASCP